MSTHVSVSLKLEVYFFINQHGEFVNAKATTLNWRHFLMLAKRYELETGKLRLAEHKGAMLQEGFRFHLLPNKSVSDPLIWSVSLWIFNDALPVAYII
jgi:hypothetical protein